MKMEDKNIKNVLDYIHDLLFILDWEGRIIEVNEAAVILTGRTKDRLIKNSILELFASQYHEQIKDILRSEEHLDNELVILPLITGTSLTLSTEIRFSSGQWNGQPVIIALGRYFTESRFPQWRNEQVFITSQNLMAISALDTGELLDVNPCFTAVLGYEYEEVIGKTTREINLYPDYKMREEMLSLFNRQGYLEDYEIAYRKKTGEILHVQVSLRVLNTPDHKYLLTTATDITRLKKSEDNLKYLLDQQKFLADIAQELNTPEHLEKTLDKIMVRLGGHTDVSRVYIFENSADGLTCSNTYEWCNTGIDPQIQLLQNVPYEIIPSWSKILISEGRLFSKNIWELPGDLTDILGPQGIKSILIYPLYVRGSYYGFIGFDECINNKEWPEEETELLRAVANMLSNAFERREMINTIRESELRLNMAINSTEEGLWDWNIKTGAVYFNDIWSKMLGYEPGELENDVSTWKNLIHPEDTDFVMDEINKFLLDEIPYYETAHRLKTKDGSWKWMLDKGMIIERDADNSPLRAIGLHIDITKQKETELELQKLVQTKDKFFSIIAHDLRNPLTILSNFSQLIIESIKENNIEETESYSEILYSVSKNTISLLENLLTWARSQKGELRIDPTVNKISGVAEENIALFSSAAAKKKIRIINSVPHNINAFFDRDAVLAVIRNLLSNAIKFTLPGGSIEIGAKENSNAVEVFIKDDGVGIPESVIDKLFQMDSHYTTRGTASEGGSGLGLILCKELIEKNGGTIKVGSRNGEGSTFTFTLPKPLFPALI